MAAATIERVVDGDTVEGARGTRVRLLLIDAPELSQRPFGDQARRALTRLVPVGAQVTLETDVEPRDRYGRLLVYLYMPDGAALNHVLVTAGYAAALTVPPNDRYATVFERAERGARLARSGMWSRPGCAG